MKHSKLKFRETGEAQTVRHSTIKKFCTALNHTWSSIPRKLPFRLAALCAEMKSEKKKDEKELIAAGEIEDDGGREDMTFMLYCMLAMCRKSVWHQFF